MSGPPPGTVIDSAVCALSELCREYVVDDAARQALQVGSGWTRSWSAGWLLGGGQVVVPVRDLAMVGLAGARPVRRFSWRAAQRHRPGLQFLVSTGSHHGFESLEERVALLAVDFAADAVAVLCQPFRLRYRTGEGWRVHVPDFLVESRRGQRWLIDVRPLALVRAEDAVAFAACGEVALVCGWRYLVVAGWRRHVAGVLDALSAQRRGLEDRLGLSAQLATALSGGPRRFVEAVDETSVPAVARAVLLHHLWHRRFAVDLGLPLSDASLVWIAEGGRW